MSGYISLLILGYFPWVMVEWLIKYIPPFDAVLLAWCIIVPTSYIEIKHKDYISIIFLSGFLAYCINLFWHIHFLEIYSDNISLAVATVALFSILVKKPFTLIYAKRQVDQNKWSSIYFIKLNLILSAMWVVIFFCEYFIGTLLNNTNGDIINVALIIIGYYISSKYPKYYLRNKNW